MNILLTGHNGYIGSILLIKLLTEGYNVSGFDNDYFSDCKLFDPNSKINYLNKDIRCVNPEDLFEIDAVIHLAALSNDPLGELNPHLTDEINHRSSIKLAKAAKSAGVKRFLFSSSCSIYGQSDSDSMVDENSILNPLTEYAKSKVKTEEELSKLADDSFSPVYLRNATAYGLSPRLRTDVVVNNLTCWAYTTGSIKLMSDGTSWRPLVHVDDISNTFCEILKSPIKAIHNQAFNVGENNQNYTVKQIAEIVTDCIPNSKIEYSPSATTDNRTYRVDFSKIHSSLPNLQHNWTVEKGVDQLIQAFAKFGMTKKEFLSSKFIRLSRLQELISNQLIDNNLNWLNNK